MPSAPVAAADLRHVGFELAHDGQARTLQVHGLQPRDALVCAPQVGAQQVVVEQLGVDDLLFGDVARVQRDDQRLPQAVAEFGRPSGIELLGGVAQQQFDLEVVVTARARFRQQALELFRRLRSPMCPLAQHPRQQAVEQEDLHREPVQQADERRLVVAGL